MLIFLISSAVFSAASPETVIAAPLSFSFSVTSLLLLVTSLLIAIILAP